MIHWELNKKLKFDHTNKWYKHKPTSVLENYTHKLQWDFDIQTDHLISVRSPDLLLINNKIWKIVNFAVPADNCVKVKRKINRLTLLGNWKTMEHTGDNYTNCNWWSWYSNQRINKWTGGLWNKRTSRDYPNYYIIEIGQNTEKTPRDLRRLPVTQTPVKDHKLTLIGKIIKEKW